MDVLLPKGWPRPRGYSNGIAAEGRLVFVSGQVGWTAEEKFEAADLVGQIRQALKNTLAVLGEAGAAPKHVVRMTWFITDKREYRAHAKEIGTVYREAMGRHYPAMALVEVKSLLENEAKVEIETTAVIPR